MELTGKCKEDFDKWYSDKYFPSIESLAGHRISLIDKGNISLNRFYTLQPEMQWGVYVDFFDTIDIPIEDSVRFEPTMQGFKVKFYNYFIKGKKSRRNFINRIDSRNDAIKQVNDIYNGN